MHTNRFRSIGLPLLLVSLGGLVGLAVTFLLYGLVYNLLELTFYPTDPLSFPAGLVRSLFALVLVVLYLVLVRIKIPDLLQAVLMISPVAMTIVAATFAFYEQPAVFIPLMLAIPILWAALLYRARKPWIHYYALGIAALAAIIYAWPRS